MLAASVSMSLRVCSIASPPARAAAPCRAAEALLNSFTQLPSCSLNSSAQPCNRTGPDHEPPFHSCLTKLKPVIMRNSVPPTAGC